MTPMTQIRGWILVSDVARQHARTHGRAAAPDTIQIHNLRFICGYLRFICGYLRFICGYLRSICG